MEELRQRIMREGRVPHEDILMVDAFLNHQVDMELMRAVGSAFAEHFRESGATRVATIESSGIAPAGMTALAMGLPLVIFKKLSGSLEDGTVYQTPVVSFTKGGRYLLTVSRRFLPAGERVLFIDDFLARGEAARGVMRLLQEASCALAGIGIVIEKSFQPGRALLEQSGCEVFSLARIASMKPGSIIFVDE